MNFFEQIFPLMDGVKKTTITINKKGDLLTVGFLPEVDNEKVNKGLRILSVTGTPQELDEAFFTSVSEVKKAIDGVVTNVEEIAKSLKSVEDKEKGAAVAKTEKKPNPKKEATKPVEKKNDTEELPTEPKEEQVLLDF